jgi:hypothetical protein
LVLRFVYPRSDYDIQELCRVRQCGTKYSQWGPGNSNHTINLSCRWGRRGGRAPVFCTEAMDVVLANPTPSVSRGLLRYFTSCDGSRGHKAEFQIRALEFNKQLGAWASSLLPSTFQTKPPRPTPIQSIAAAIWSKPLRPPASSAKPFSRLERCRNSSHDQGVVGGKSGTEQLTGTPTRQFRRSTWRAWLCFIAHMDDLPRRPESF